MASLVSALPPGSRTLVTGENGYIASHVVDKLLQQGHLARGTIRAPKPWLDEYFAQKYSPNAFESVTVSSFFEDVDIVGRVLDGGEGVVHLVWASDLTFGTESHAVFPWVVKATLSILDAAAQKPSVKRVVLCSFSSTTYMLHPDPNGRTIDECEKSDL